MLSLCFYPSNTLSNGLAAANLRKFDEINYDRQPPYWITKNVIYDITNNSGFDM